MPAGRRRGSYAGRGNQVGKRRRAWQGHLKREREEQREGAYADRSYLKSKRKKTTREKEDKESRTRMRSGAAMLKKRDALPITRKTAHGQMR